MSWLFLAGLGIIWTVCVFPWGRRGSATTSIERFGRGLDLLAETGGRWIVAPRKGAQFLGARNRARARARARRRRVLVFLLEATGLTLLMGLFPPFRPIWFATAGFAAILVLYVWALLAIRRNGREIDRMREGFAAAIDTPGRAATQANGNGNGNSHANGNGHGVHERHVAIGRGRATRPVYNGLSIIDEDEVHVVVRSAGELQPASTR